MRLVLLMPMFVLVSMTTKSSGRGRKADRGGHLGGAPDRVSTLRARKAASDGAADVQSHQAKG